MIKPFFSKQTFSHPTNKGSVTYWFRTQCIIITLASGRVMTFWSSEKNIEFQSSCILIYFSYIYRTIDGKMSFIQKFVSGHVLQVGPSSGPATAHICWWTFWTIHLLYSIAPKKTLAWRQIKLEKSSNNYFLLIVWIYLLPITGKFWEPRSILRKLWTLT